MYICVYIYIYIYIYDMYTSTYVPTYIIGGTPDPQPQTNSKLVFLV